MVKAILLATDCNFFFFLQIILNVYMIVSTNIMHILQFDIPSRNFTSGVLEELQLLALSLSR